MTKVTIWATTILLGVSSIAYSKPQETTPPRSDSPRTQTDPRTTQQGSLDKPLMDFFAAKFVLCNNGEIQAGQMAADKSENAEVKEFGRMLVQDHAALNQRLASMLPAYAERPVAPRTDLGQTDTKQEAQAKTDSALKTEQATKTGDPSAKAASQPSKEVRETSLRVESDASLEKLYHICHVAHENHSSMCKEKLSKLTGNEFDTAFLLGQIAAHSMLLAELKALESQSSGDFQSLVRDAQTKVDGHIRHAEGLVKKIARAADSARPSDR